MVLNRCASLLLFAFLIGGPAYGMDGVMVRRDGKTQFVEGRLILTAQDGGVLLLARDGTLWNIVPEEQVKRSNDERPFRPLNTEQMSNLLLTQLPKGFYVYQSAHYMIFYDTSEAYAKWCGSMFERLHMAFRNVWSRNGFEPADPEFPLVAIVFSSKQAYVKYSEKELGDAADQIIAYYNLASNRMVMYDLTGTAAPAGDRGGVRATFNKVLGSPEGMNSLATVVHEATHQIAFNSGLHARYSDCPLWFSEGIAMYFETPDLKSTRGWAGVGAVNRNRLNTFQAYLARRPADSLKTLLETDDRFRDMKQATDAYAEAWSLTYFLAKQHSKEYTEYLKILARKQPLVKDGPLKRIEEFEKRFGSWRQVDREFVRFMTKVR